MGSGFYQAPDVNVTGRGLPTPGFAGITTSDKKLRELQQFYASLQAASRGVAAFRSKYDTGEKADAYKASQEDIVRSSADIEIDDPMWEMDVWERDDDGKNTGKLISQEALSEQIHANLDVFTEGRSDVFKKSYLSRMTPALSKALIERGIGRRSNQLNNQIDDAALSVIGWAETYPEVVDLLTTMGQDPGTYSEHMEQAMQDSFDDVAAMFPKHKNETDEEHEARVRATYVEKVIPQLVDVWSSTGNMAGLDSLLNAEKGKPWTLNPVEKVKVLNKAQTGFYDSLYRQIQQPVLDQNGILSWHLPDLMDGNEPGKLPELEQITSPKMLMDYLNEPEVQDPNSVYYLSPTRKNALVRDFLKVDEAEHGKNRLILAMMEQGTVPLEEDRKWLTEVIMDMGGWDASTGIITNGVQVANWAGNAGFGKKVGTQLLRQIKSPDEETRTQAALALVVLSQHGNVNAWRELMDLDDMGENTWYALARMDQWADTHSIFDTGFEGSQSLNKQNLIFLSERLIDGMKVDDFTASSLTPESLQRAKDELNIDVVNDVMEKMVGKGMELDGWIEDTLFDDLFDKNDYYTAQFEHFYYQQYTMARQQPGSNKGDAKEFARKSLAQLITTKFDIAMIGGDKKGGIIVFLDGMSPTERWSVLSRTVTNANGDSVNLEGTTVNRTWELLQTQLISDEGRLYAGGVPVNSNNTWEDDIIKLAPMPAPAGGGWLFVTHTGDPLMFKVPELDEKGKEVKDKNGETIMKFKLARYSLNDLRTAEREEEEQEKEDETDRILKAVDDREEMLDGSTEEHKTEYQIEKDLYNQEKMKRNSGKYLHLNPGSLLKDIPKPSEPFPSFLDWWIENYGEQAQPKPSTQGQKPKPVTSPKKKPQPRSMTNFPTSGSTPSGQYPPSVQE